jgi:putative tryptophan/tyrosine transport system substrate-binding protein
MRRREFVAALGGAAAWPLVARGQPLSSTPVLGFLAADAPTTLQALSAFREGLNREGYIEDRDIAIEFRSAEGQHTRLPALVEDLVQRKVSLLVATGGISAAIAAKQTTDTIPIVFLTGDDPLRSDLVVSNYTRKSNVTGVSLYSSELMPQRIALLREIVPEASVLGLLVNLAKGELEAEDISAVAQWRGWTPGRIDAAFEALAAMRADGLIVAPDPFFDPCSEHVVTLAARHALPAIYASRSYPRMGGLMSYGPDALDGYRSAGVYAAKILKGAKPADLPVQRPTKFELAINLSTARLFGLGVPPALLGRADDIIT